jgi:hypothetical protein
MLLQNTGLIILCLDMATYTIKFTVIFLSSNWHGCLLTQNKESWFLMVKLSRNRPWRPRWLFDVEAPTFFIQSTHRWLPFTPQEDSWYSFLLEAESTPGHSAAVRIRSIKKSSDLIKKRTHNLPAYSIVSQQTTLPRAPGFLWFCPNGNES